VKKLLNFADLPQDMASRGRELPMREQAARSAAPGIFAPEVRDHQLDVVIAGVRGRASVAAMEMMQQADMGPATFQRIKISGTNAEVAFTAETRRLTKAAGWIDEGPSQWQLQLEKVNGRWLLLSNSSLGLGGEG
jgi:hypothetical protein